MQFAAIPQPTCAWLLAHSNILEALFNALTAEDISGLSKAEFSSGPMRMVGSEDQRVLAIWNREYLSGTGSELWGVFKLQGPHSLDAEPTIKHQVFERTLYVMNQRLQGLILDSELIHRPWPNGSHTCLAGRGTEARQYSIAYLEGGPGYADLNSRAIFVIGPEHDFQCLQIAIDGELKNFAPAVQAANSFLDSQRRRPLLEEPALQSLREALAPNPMPVATPSVYIDSDYGAGSKTVNAYETVHWDYTQWVQSGSLNEAQKRILNSDAPTRHPLRIMGPAGSGKTLLMQLLAIKHLKSAASELRELQVLYIVHNAAMAQTVIDRFRTLGAEDYLTGNKQALSVRTLSEYGRTLIGLAEGSVIDKDAQRTKEFQFEQIQTALREALAHNASAVSDSKLLSQVRDDPELFELFAALVMAEISSVIKGRGLIEDQQRYVRAEAPLSRLHRILSQDERTLVFDVYLRYHHVIFEQYEMLDSDDVALSLAGRLRTPVWSLKRRSDGFDFVFVDEAQLFNENERRIFPYLTKGTLAHIPIALALDEAQEPFGFSNAGLATLGIENAENEELPSNHRSTRAIIQLAFFVIQRSTDLFGSEFPDFTNVEIEIASSAAETASPRIVRCNEEAPSFAKFILRLVQKFRAKNIRQIAVICHAETYWAELVAELESSQLPLHVITQRGEKLTPDQPLVVLSRPSFIGGQEFDAVILVGLEQGVMPPRIPDNPPLSAALEQQVLREIYLAVTRARYNVVVALNKHATCNTIIDAAAAAGFLAEGAIT